MKPLFTNALCGILFFPAMPQSLQPSLITLNGGFVKTQSGRTMSWNLGGTIFQTSNAEKYILSHRFQQPVLNFSTSLVNLQTEYGIKVYPNPTFSKITLEPSHEEKLFYRLMDMEGEGNYSFDYMVTCKRRGMEDFSVNRQPPSTNQIPYKKMVQNLPPGNIKSIRDLFKKDGKE